MYLYNLLDFYLRNGYWAPEIIWKTSVGMTPNYPAETPLNKTRRFIIFILYFIILQKKGLSCSAVSICHKHQKRTLKQKKNQKKQLQKKSHLIWKWLSFIANKLLITF